MGRSSAQRKQFAPTGYSDSSCAIRTGAKASHVGVEVDGANLNQSQWTFSPANADRKIPGPRLQTWQNSQIILPYCRRVNGYYAFKAFTLIGNTQSTCAFSRDIYNSVTMKAGSSANCFSYCQSRADCLREQTIRARIELLRIQS